MSHKAKRAVLISLEKEDGSYRLILDDLLAQNDSAVHWQKADHYTSNTYPEANIKDIKFDEKELADIGLMVIARLCAFMKHDES